ncbi:DUF4181 domain-containing protein [Paenibacillus lautus]|uniref:DUF4181 domain-containing protein n=1 Tax=Paenibacillus lautus TaxID=1401 RepID=UPI003D2A3D6C
MDVAGIFVILMLTQLVLRKFMVVEEDRISDTEGDTVYLRGNVIMVIVVVGAAILGITGVITWIILTKIWLVALTIFLGFRSYMQWKYIPHTKEHHVTLIILVVSGIITLWVVPLK